MMKDVVTRAALVKRINRKLRPQGQMLRKPRSSRSWSDLGDYYIMDIERSLVVAGHVDPEEFSREIRVLP